MTWKELISRATPLLIIILLISYFTGDGWSAIPSGLVAWGTILLAYATFSLIKQSKEQETRRIISEQEDAKTNNNLRILDEVIQWATDIANRRVDINVNSAIELQRSLEFQLVKGAYMLKIVSPFNQDLVEAVQNLYTCLVQELKVMRQLNKTPIRIKSAGREKELGELQDHSTEVTKSFIKFIDEATKIKLSILRR